MFRLFFQTIMFFYESYVLNVNSFPKVLVKIGTNFSVIARVENVPISFRRKYHSVIVLNLCNFNWNKSNCVANISVPDFEFPYWSYSQLKIKITNSYRLSSGNWQENNYRAPTSWPHCY